MGLILDTSILIDIERNFLTTLNKLRDIAKKDTEEAVISFIVYFEYLFGLIGKSEKNQQFRLEKINKFNCLGATKQTAVILSELKYKYEKKGISFSLADIIIAAQAREHNLTLVTKDSQFKEIEEIKSIIL